MLTWMQHHKKYLVITVWISAIAFIGASAVGWGTFDLNLNRSSSVAMVGDEKISLSEFNNRYNQIFNYYNQISNGGLDEETAKQLQIDNIALNSLIQDKLLLSYAKDLGLSYSEDEILKILAATPEFHNSQGIFDKNIYYQLLAQNNISTEDYESFLANEIILGKLNGIFNLPSKDTELQMLASSYFMQDSLSIAAITLNENNKSIDENKLKQLWQKHSSNYKTQKTYEISSYFLKANANNFSDEELKKFYNEADNKLKYKDFSGKILNFEAAKKDVEKDYALSQVKNLANEKFLELNSGKIKFEKDLNITDSDVYYPINLLQNARIGQTLKPFELNDGYMIIRLNKINPSRIKTFEEAKADILPLYESEQNQESLKAKASAQLANFSGINIGFVSRDSQKDPKKINDNILNNADFSYFLMNVFNSDQNKSYVILNDTKAILYKINKQKLFSQSKLNQYKTMLDQNLKNLKANAIKQELITELRKQYPIKIYYK